MTDSVSSSNPVLQFALSEYPVDSVTTLAKQAGLTYGTVHKTIQGLYGSIPKSLAEFLASNSEYREAYWQHQYSLWVKDQLEILKEDIIEGRIEAEALYCPAERLYDYSPSFKKWRESLSYSQIDFCKTFLLHQTIINNYESGKMKNLPVSLKERLKYLGCSEEYIKALGELPV